MNAPNLRATIIDSWVVSVAPDGAWAHVYASEKDAILGAEKLPAGTAAEYYDATGRPMTATTGPAGDLQALRAEGQPVPDAVLGRLRALVQRAPELARQDSGGMDAYLAEHGVTLDEVLRRLPRLDGLDLPQALEAGQSLFGPHAMDAVLQDKGSPWHMLVAHHLH